MLKKIRIDELRLGMHLDALCGSWVDHPFWKTRFVLRDENDLGRLRQSGLAECWIDPGKGLDVAAADRPVPPLTGLPAAAPAAEVRPESARAEPAGSSVSIESELGRACALLHRSREVMQSLLGDARLGRALEAERCVPLVDDIASSVGRNPDAFVSLARLKTHDGYSFLHSVAVCALMVSLARRLGFDTDAARDAGLAGLLHDIGKALIPLEVLNKPGKLTVAEFAIVKAHPTHGHALLLGSPAVSGAALDVCLHHHERPDGKGYPHGLAAAGLSQIARMGAVCDVYDAVTSNRPYKSGWDPAEALARMAQGTQGGQFDAGVFRTFLDSLGVYPVGSLVRMASGRLGVVVEQSPDSLVQPRVKVFFSTRSMMPIPVELLDTSSARCTDRIAARESNERWKFGHLDEVWAGREVLAKAARASA